MIDDVITAGTTFRQVVQMIHTIKRHFKLRFQIFHRQLIAIEPHFLPIMSGKNTGDFSIIRMNHLHHLSKGGARRYDVINHAKITGVFTAHDRQEVGLNGDQLAVKDLKAEFKVPFYSMIKLTDIIQYLDVQGKMTCELERLRDYQTEYGVML